MVMATTERPVRAAEMGRTEAEQVTQAIKDNFDSLGAMLAMARDRKAYRALGYRSFETYCQSEFGKSISSAYQLIEDAKVLSQLEARISEEYGESITLNFPSSHLKPLKEIDNIDDKLKAIEYANKLAAAENRKATKKDLEIAVFQISGKRSEDFSAAIQGLGFSRGVQVEVVKSLKKDRGWVTKVDKAGKIHVEFHYGSIAAIPYDAADLRILSEDEQPTKPANEDITNKGDRVLIFSPALRGKKGTIFQWKSGKQALVIVDGMNSPIDIAYAEMELVKKVEERNANWDSELVWESGKNTYYYFPKEDKIYSNKWPSGLTLEPYTHELSPIDFMVNWEDKFAGELLEGLVTPAKLKTLVLAQAIELPEEEGKEFASDLITSLSQLFPESFSTLTEENQRLLVQLAEAEAVIESMIAASNLPVLEPVEPVRSLPKETKKALPSTDPTTDPTLDANESWLSVLESNAIFQTAIRLDGEPTEIYRGWDIYVYDSSVADIFHPSKGIFSTDFSWHREDKEIINRLEWLKTIINQVEDFCPSQLSLTLNTEIESFPQALLTAISKQEQKIRTTIGKKEYQHQSAKLTKRENAAISANNLQRLEDSLQELRDFQLLRIGQPVAKQFSPDVKGRITGFELSIGGMPVVWVAWVNEYGESRIAEQCSLKVLSILSPAEEDKE